MSALRSRFRRSWQRVRTEPRLLRNVAAILVLVVLAASTGGYILSQLRVQWPWDSQFVFHATFPATPGISPGNGQEVRIAGVTVGYIVGADVNKQGQARLKLSIDSRYEVYRNATVVLRPKNPLNPMYVALNPGGPPAQKLPEAGTLPIGQSKRPIQIDEALGHLEPNARHALTTLLSVSDTALAGAAQQLPSGLSATDRVARKLRPVVQALQTRRDKLRTLVSSMSEVAHAIGKDGGRLGQLSKSLNKTLKVLGDPDGNLNKVLHRLPEFSQQLQEATSAVQELSDQLDPTLDHVKKAADHLPESLKKLTAVIDEVGKTVDVGSPALRKAEPVLADLRPFTTDLNSALPDVKGVTSQLPRVTKMLVPSLEDLGAFFINTRSVTSLEDANGGILRAFVKFAPSSVLHGDPLKSLGTPAAKYKFPQ